MIILIISKSTKETWKFNSEIDSDEEVMFFLDNMKDKKVISTSIEFTEETTLEDVNNLFKGYGDGSEIKIQKIIIE